MTFIEALNNESTRNMIEGIEEWSEKAEAGCKIAQGCMDSLIADLKKAGYDYKG